MKIIGFLCFILFSSLTFAQSEKETVIFLVRHAEKSLESTDNPSLSEKGKQQALHLAQILQNTGIEAIFSTDTKRTKETAQPLAEKLGLTTELYSSKDKNFAGSLLQKYSGKKIVLIGHSNTLPDFLNFFSQSNQYQPSDNYGDLFVIVIKPRQPATILKLHFD
jgi:phosphohistidine phosphatase SixA